MIGSADTRELLAQPNPFAADPTTCWTGSPTTRARTPRPAIGRGTEPRIADRRDDPSAVGFTQALAGAHELLEHYRIANPRARLVLDAAADARRLGHGHALPEVLLREMADGRRRAEQPPRAAIRPLAAGWFDDAVAEAGRPLRTDGVQALFVIEDPDTGSEGYALADYLEHHLALARTLRPIPDPLWHALRRHTHHGDDLAALARAAAARGRIPLADQLYQQAVAAGNSHALHQWFWWLGTRRADQEHAYRAAVAAGYTARDLVIWLSTVGYRNAEVEQLYGRPSQGVTPSRCGHWPGGCGRARGDPPRAERLYREAIAVGDCVALRELAELLRDIAGRDAEVEQLYREAIAAGDTNALRGLAGWLRKVPGRGAEAEQLYREAIAARDAIALRELAKWYSNTPLQDDAGRGLAAKLYREAVAAGDTFALMELAEFLDFAGWDDGCRATLPERRSRRVTPARCGSSAWWLREIRGVVNPKSSSSTGRRSRRVTPTRCGSWPGGCAIPRRWAEAEQLYRGVVAAGRHPQLATGVGQVAAPDPRSGTPKPNRPTGGRSRRVTPARSGSWRAGCARSQVGTPKPNRPTRGAVAAGDTSALRELAGWLRQIPGRDAEAEQAYRGAVTAGDTSALQQLAEWLHQIPGREAEAAALRRWGVDAYGNTVPSPEPERRRDPAHGAAPFPGLVYCREARAIDCAAVPTTSIWASTDYALDWPRELLCSELLGLYEHPFQGWIPSYVERLLEEAFHTEIP